MTPDPRDELAALDKTPRGWTRTAFLPLDPAEAERPGIRRGPLGQPIAWHNIVAWTTQEPG